MLETFNYALAAYYVFLGFFGGESEVEDTLPLTDLLIFLVKDMFIMLGTFNCLHCRL